MKTLEMASRRVSDRDGDQQPILTAPPQLPKARDPRSAGAGGAGWAGMISAHSISQLESLVTSPERPKPRVPEILS